MKRKENQKIKDVKTWMLWAAEPWRSLTSELLTWSIFLWEISFLKFFWRIRLTCCQEEFVYVGALGQQCTMFYSKTVCGSVSWPSSPSSCGLAPRFLPRNSSTFGDSSMRADRLEALFSAYSAGHYLVFLRRNWMQHLSTPEVLHPSFDSRQREENAAFIKDRPSFRIARPRARLCWNSLQANHGFWSHYLWFSYMQTGVRLIM